MCIVCVLEFDRNQNLCFLWEYTDVTQSILHHISFGYVLFISNKWRISTVDVDWSNEKIIEYQSVGFRLSWSSQGEISFVGSLSPWKRTVGRHSTANNVPFNAFPMMIAPVHTRAIRLQVKKSVHRVGREMIVRKSMDLLCASYQVSPNDPFCFRSSIEFFQRNDLWEWWFLSNESIDLLLSERLYWFTLSISFDLFIGNNLFKRRFMSFNVWSEYTNVSFRL